MRSQCSKWHSTRLGGEQSPMRPSHATLCFCFVCFAGHERLKRIQSWTVTILPRPPPTPPALDRNQRAKNHTILSPRSCRRFRLSPSPSPAVHRHCRRFGLHVFSARSRHFSFSFVVVAAAHHCLPAPSIQGRPPSLPLSSANATAWIPLPLSLTTPATVFHL
ncbi:hypothetical protein BC828DRAFT_296220 [Blastocladiella britannica]|nr:hypothetical protein BC828DRAFT_296220 [Blastocladiella britannica]